MTLNYSVNALYIHPRMQACGLPICRGSYDRSLENPKILSLEIVHEGDLPRDVVSVLNVSVSRRSRDVFWNVSSRLGLEG